MHQNESRPRTTWMLALFLLSLCFLSNSASAVILCAPMSELGGGDNAKPSGSAHVPSIDEILEARGKLVKKAGIHKDPFLFVSDTKEGGATWRGLMDAFPVVEDLSRALWNMRVTRGDIDHDLQRDAMAEIEDVIGDKRATMEEVGAAIIATRQLEELRAWQSTELVHGEPSKDGKGEQGQGQGKDGKQDTSKGQQEAKNQPPQQGKPGQGKPQKGEDVEDKPHQMHKNEKEYQAGNLDLEGDNQKNKTPPVSVALVNRPGLRYWYIGEYQIVNARTNRWAKTSVTRPLVYKGRIASTYALQRPHASKGQDVSLYVPEGYMPELFKSADGHVWESNGNYYFNTKKDELRVPLVEQGGATRPLVPTEIEPYTRPTDVKLEEWPENLQLAVNQLKQLRQHGAFDGDEGDVLLSRVLASTLATEFKYRTTGDPEGTSAMELAHKGAFQCSTAATILATLLRNEFAIPCTIREGFMGHEDEAMPDWSHVIDPDTGHAWVSVFDKNGNPHGVDGTPIEKENPDHKDEENPDTNFKKIQSPEPPAKPPATDENGRPLTHDGTPDSQSENRKMQEIMDEVMKVLEEHEAKKVGEQDTPTDNPELQKLVDDLMKKAAEEHAAQSEAGKEGTPPEGSAKPGEGDQEGAPHSQDKSPAGEGTEKEAKKKINTPAPPPKHDDESALKKISEGVKRAKDALFRKSEEKNALISKAQARMILWALDPTLSSRDKQQRIDSFKTVLSGERSVRDFPSLQRLASEFSEATLLFQGNHLPFGKRIDNLIAQRGNFNDFVLEMAEIEKQIDFTLKFMEEEERKPLERMLMALTRLRNALYASPIKPERSREIRIAEDVFDNLSGKVARQRVQRDYNLHDRVGNDAATLKLAKDIVGGKLDEERLQSLLAKHTDFLTDPVNQPSKGERRLWYKDPRGRRKRSLLPDRDPRTIRRKGFSLDPNLSDAEARRRGQYVEFAKRKTVEIPQGNSTTIPEKWTIIGLDLSGSMAGAKAEFQSNYTAALVSRALSESRDGKVNHRVLLATFDDQVRYSVEISTVEEAVKFMGDLKVTKRIGGGTSNEAFLMWARDKLLTSKANSKTGLAQATVLCSGDGQDDVNEKRVRDAYADVRRADKNGKTSLMLGFIAIGETNPVFQKLSNADLGANNSLYREWSYSDISYFNRVAAAKPEPITDFWTAVDWDGLPHDIEARIAELRNEAAGYEVRQASARRSMPMHVEEMKLLSQRPPETTEEERDGNHVLRLKQLRRYLDFVGHLFTSADRSKILLEVLRIWPEVVADPVSVLDRKELIQLNHLFNWPSLGGTPAP